MQKQFMKFHSHKPRLYSDKYEDEKSITQSTNSQDLISCDSMFSMKPLNCREAFIIAAGQTMGPGCHHDSKRKDNKELSSVL